MTHLQINLKHKPKSGLDWIDSIHWLQPGKNIRFEVKKAMTIFYPDFGYVIDEIVKVGIGEDGFCRVEVRVL